MPEENPRRRVVVMRPEILSNMEAVANIASRKGSSQPQAPGKDQSDEGAIISDIHANGPAYAAVLEDIASRGIAREKIYNLGDVLGYGGNILEVIVNTAEYSLGKLCIGNHEAGIIMAIGALRAIQNGIAGADPYGMLREKGVSEIAARGMVKTGEIILKSKHFANIVKFIKGLPRQIRILDNAKGIHGFREQLHQDIAMRYVMPLEIAEEYGIKEKSLIRSPVQVIYQAGLVDDGVTKAVFIGHDHSQYAFAIKKNTDIHRIYIPRETSRNGLIGTFEIRPDEIAVISGGGTGATKRKDLKSIEEMLKVTKKRGYDSLLPANYATYNGSVVKFYEFFYDYKRAEDAIKSAGMPNTFKLEVED